MNRSVHIPPEREQIEQQRKFVSGSGSAHEGMGNQHGNGPLTRDASTVGGQKDPETAAKVLLLGPASAGKSTLFARMRELALGGDGWADDATIKTLRENAEQRSECLADGEPVVPELPVAQMEQLNHVEFFHRHGKALLSHTFQFDGEHSHDRRRRRMRTTGIIEMQVAGLTVFDVGGARSERKKWIHIFGDAALLYYCMSCLAPLCTLWEDNTVNTWDESVAVLRELWASKWLKSTHVVIILTQWDSLEYVYKRDPDKVERIMLRHMEKDEKWGPVGSSGRLRPLLCALLESALASFSRRDSQPKSSIFVCDLVDDWAGARTVQQLLTLSSQHAKVTASEKWNSSMQAVDRCYVSPLGQSFELRFTVGRSGWSPRTHLEYPPEFRARVFAMLLWQHRTKLLSKDVLVHVLLPMLAQMERWNC
jgi:hypothetical protein